MVFIANARLLPVLEVSSAWGGLLGDNNGNEGNRGGNDGGNDNGNDGGNDGNNGNDGDVGNNGNGLGEGNGSGEFFASFNVWCCVFISKDLFFTIIF